MKLLPAPLKNNSHFGLKYFVARFEIAVKIQKSVSRNILPDLQLLSQWSTYVNERGKRLIRINKTVTMH